MRDLEWVDHQAARRSGLQGASGFTLDSFTEAARVARRGLQRVFIVAHAFAGDRREGGIHEWLDRFADEHRLQLLILSIDLAFDPAWDLADPLTIHQLMVLAKGGFIDIILGGPPCATWSRARFLPMRGGSWGPRPLRWRTDDEIWGRCDLWPSVQARVTEANVLMVNFLALCEAVSLRGGGHLCEHPEDPGMDPYPSVWATDLMIGLEDRVGAVRILLDQCMYGGPAPKVTCLSGTLQGLSEGEIRCDRRHAHGRSSGLNEHGQFHTRRLQTYPSGLSRFIALRITRTLLAMRRDGSGPGCWRRAEALRGLRESAR